MSQIATLNTTTGCKNKEKITPLSGNGSGKDPSTHTVPNSQAPHLLDVSLTNTLKAHVQATATYGGAKGLLVEAKTRSAIHHIAWVARSALRLPTSTAKAITTSVYTWLMTRPDTQGSPTSKPKS